VQRRAARTGWRLLAIAGVFLGLAFGLVAISPPAQAARPATSCPSLPYVNGFDVSHFSDTITWSKVTCEDFVYAEATDGTAFADPTFSANRAGALGAGIPFGAEDVFEPNEAGGAQATAFLGVYSPRPGDPPPALEVETADSQTAATIVAGIGTWVSAVEAATGIVPVIYTPYSFWASTLENSTAYTTDPLWDAAVGAGPPPVPASDWGGNSWTLWQYDLNGTVSGVPENGATDLDYFAGANLTSLESSPATTVTITSHSAKPVVGRPITLYTRVAGSFTGSEVPTPSGSVTVSDGTHSCKASLSGSGGIATGSCAITEATAGTHSFTASFPGDSNWHASVTSKGTSISLAKATSTTTLKLSTKRVTYGDEQAEHLSVTVTSAYAGSKPTGRVTIEEGATKLCVVTLVSGKGSCKLSAKELKVGVYRLVATYGGGANFGDSTSAKETLTVAKG
jgi:lysozyme